MDRIIDNLRNVADRAYVRGANATVQVSARDLGEVLDYVSRLARAADRLATTDGVTDVNKRLAAMKD